MKHVFSFTLCVLLFCLILQVPANAETPTAITLPPEITLPVRQVKTLRPNLTPKNASTEYTWASNDETIAQVASAGGYTSGNVTGISPGTTTITVRTSNNLTASCVVTIEDAPLPSAMEIPKTLSISVGDYIDIHPMLFPSNATSLYSITTTDGDIVQASTTGGHTGCRIHGQTPGTALIAITSSNNLTSTCTVTVTSKNIYFNPNGGAWTGGEIEPQAHTFDTKGVVLESYSKQLSKPGHVFIGWNTVADGSGIRYTFDDFISPDSIENNTVLYAQWIATTIEHPHVFFDDTSLGAAYSIYDYTEPYSVPTLEREGYTFIGWQSDPGWSITNYFIFPDGDETVRKSLFFYPIWVSNNSIENWLIVSPNGGNFNRVENAAGIIRDDLPYFIQPYENQGSAYDYYDNQSLDTLLEIEERYLYREGYTFIGWNTKADGTGTQYASGEFVPAAGLKTFLYAQWEKLPENYHVFHAVDGEFSDGSTVKVFDRTVEYTIPLLEREGYVFSGWQADQPSTNGHGDWLYQLFTEGVERITDKDVHFYPLWFSVDSPANSLILNANGGKIVKVEDASGNMYNDLPYYYRTFFNDDPSHWQQSYIDRCVPTLQDVETNHLQRDGYTFVGWNTKPDGSGTQYKSGEFVPSAGLKTFLYAQWQKIGHPSPTDSVPMFRMYDPNGGEHFYTGSWEERDGLVALGWNYEGVAFNFPAVGDPVHRLYNPVSGDHLYTMDEDELNDLLDSGWNYEGVAFNSATSDQVPQYRVWNPNAVRGAWHFTGSTEERDWLMSLGWQYQGIGWYSEWV